MANLPRDYASDRVPQPQQTASDSAQGSNPGIGHGQLPGPQSMSPEPPAGGLMAQFLNLAVPQAHSVTVEHAQETQRQPLPSMSFDVQVDGLRHAVTAVVSPALTQDLTDLQHNRVAALLSVPARDGHPPSGTAAGEGRIQVTYEIDDPQATPGGEPPRIRMQLEVRLRGPGEDSDRIDAMVLGTGGDRLLLPVRERRPFESSDQTMQALVPHGAYSAEQLQALQARTRVRGLASVEGSSNLVARYRYSVPERDGAPARYFSATVELRRNAAMGAWVVVGVTADPIERPRLQVRQDCFDWLAAGLKSPGLTDHVVEAIRGYIDAHNTGSAQPVGVRFRTNALGQRLEVNLHLRNAEGTLERWHLAVSFTRHGQRDIVANVDVFESPTLAANVTVSVHARPDMDGWQNVLAARTERAATTGSAITQSSVSQGSGNVRPRSPGDEEQRSVRQRLDEDDDRPFIGPLGNDQNLLDTMSLMTDLLHGHSTGSSSHQGSEPLPSEIRRQQHRLLEALQAEETTSPTSATSTAVPPAASARSQSPQDVFLTQAAYRTRYGLTRGPVCPAIAAGAALGHHVPYSALQQVHGENGATAAQMRTLLVNEGVSPVQVGFDQLSGATHGSAVPSLQQHLQANGHDAAVLLHRTDTPSDDGMTMLDHHVAIYQEGNQWMLHDGAIYPGWPVPVSMDEIVRRTFGANTQGAGEIQVLSFVRPAGGATAGTFVPAGTTGGEAAVFQSGPVQLSLASTFRTTQDTQWRDFLRDNGIRAMHLPSNAQGTVDWRQAATDLVQAVCNEPARLHLPGRVYCAAVRLPPWNTGGTGFEGAACNIDLTVQDNEVTAIRLSHLRLPPAAGLTMNPAQWDGMANTLYQSVKRFHPTLLAALPRRQGVNHVDWAAAVDQILTACGQAAAMTDLDPDEAGREVVEYAGVQIAGVTANVQLRFNDRQLGAVRDMRIYDPGRAGGTPGFRWPT